jgi:acid phosphatase (class A)
MKRAVWLSYGCALAAPVLGSLALLPQALRPETLRRWTHWSRALGLLTLCSVVLCSSVNAQVASPAPAVSPAPLKITYVNIPAAVTRTSLPPWPTPESTAARDDLAVVLQWQSTRSRADLDEAQIDATRGALIWAQDPRALGPQFTRERYPVITSLLLALNEDMRGVNRAANALHGARLRPAATDARVTPGITLGAPETPSYPSARAASSRAWATLLARIFPERRTALFAQAARTAELRVLAGLHFPSDIEAAVNLADSVLASIESLPTFQAALAAAQAEAQTQPLR